MPSDRRDDRRYARTDRRVRQIGSVAARVALVAVVVSMAVVAPAWVTMAAVAVGVVGATVACSCALLLLTSGRGRLEDRVVGAAGVAALVVMLLVALLV